MLSITGRKRAEKIDVELDDYVPLKIRCEGGSPAPHLYWRTGNLESTLLEIEIDPADGQLIGVSLLLTGEVSRGLPNLSAYGEPSQGVPLARIRDWPEGGYVDDPGQLRVFVEDGRLLMLLGDGVTSESFSVRNVSFGIASDASLLWILVKDLDPQRLVRMV